MAKRQSAFNKALQEAQHNTTVEHADSETVSPSNGEEVNTPSSKIVKKLDREVTKSGLEKTSFYIRHDQADKLDDLAHEYKKRTGKRINRNDIVRALIDETDLEHLLQTTRLGE